MIYPKLKPEKRIEAVASLGFDSVDIWDWRDKDLKELRTQLKENGVRLNTFGGHRDSSPTIREDRRAFLEELKISFGVAGNLGCSSVMVYSDGLMSPVPGGDRPVSPAKPNGLPEKDKLSNMCDALERAVDLAEKEGITLLLESLNTTDHPGYFLSRSRPAIEVVRKAGSRRLKMLYDIYHMQVAEGNITETLVNNLDNIGYIHYADVPGRHEPGTGELNLGFILGRLKDAGFRGGFGFEFVPSNGDRSALTSTKRQLSRFWK